jgi:hypothetical protein
MIPDTHEYIRENLSETEILQVENAQQRIGLAEKDLQLARVGLQNVLANLGATGNCQVIRDEANAVHLIQPKEQEACEPSSVSDSPPSDS